MLAAWLAVVSSTPGARAASDPHVRDLLLDVVVNGHAVGLIGEFQERNGKLYAKRTELTALGFRLKPAGRNAKADEELPLSAMQGVTYKVDEHTQTIYVTAPASALKPTVLGESTDQSSQLPVESGYGAVSNYGVTGTHVSGRTLVNGVFDNRVFTPWGVADTSFTASNAPTFGTAPLVRLDSNFIYSDPATLTQYHLGDVISGGLAWTRPVRLGGAQISTDFAIRPDLVTIPVPTITGQVAVPSSVDVLINGVQELSQSVPPGPFEIRQLPVVTGVGNVDMVIRNEAGQQTTQSLTMYESQSLLKPGLSNMSVELGMVRLNYGVAGDTYRAAAGSASYRYGVYNWLTLEGHAEGSGGSGGTFEGLRTTPGAMAGGGAAVALGPLGVISADIAGSHFGRNSGGLASIAYERIGPVFSFSGSLISTKSNFGDLASVFGDPVPSIQARASVGLTIPSVGSLGLVYVLIRRPAVSVSLTEATLGDAVPQNAFGSALTPLALASRTSLLSATFTRPLFGGRANIFATGFHDFAQSASTGFTAGITFSFGRRTSVSASGTSGDGASETTIEAIRSAGEIGQAGYQLLDSFGQTQQQLAIATYHSVFGTFDAGIDRLAGSTAIRADVQGAVAYEAGGVFVANPINDSFAVVDTDGAPNIEVLQENRPIGRTNASGQFLVPDLRSFEANRLAINADDVPLDAEVGPVTKLVRPQDRSGVVVRFPVHASHGAIVKLTDKAGIAIHVGSSAKLSGSAHPVDLTVGFDGEVYATGLKHHNEMLVVPTDGPRCKAVFDYVPEAGALPSIGPVRCREAPW